MNWHFKQSFKTKWCKLFNVSGGRFLQVDTVAKLGIAPLLASLLLLASCGTLAPLGPAMRYSEYTGKDVSSFLGTWPVGQGSMAETSYRIPVYRGWPEKPYRVLGSLSSPDANKQWDEGMISAAVWEAGHHKADAIIIRQGAEFGVSQIAGAKSNPSVLWSSYQTTALAIRWLSQQEISERNLRLDELLKRFSVNDPRISVNRDVGQLVIIYLLISGYDLNSQEMSARFVETMGKVVASAAGDLSGDWIFKASLTFSSGFSGDTERNFIGLATVSTDGENVTIVSTAGNLELNFTGTQSKGRLSGQLGAASVSAKCEGASTREKISMNFQSLTPDGTARGNVTLQRLSPKQRENEIQQLPFQPKDNEKIKSDSPSRST